MKHYVLFTILLTRLLQVNAQLVVDNSVNAVDGVQNVLVGTGVTVSNITFSGTNEQIGAFSCGGLCNAGIANGLIIASGNVNQAVGNNSLDASGGPASGFSYSDADLELLTGETFNDAAVLEFDFVPSNNLLQFDFVFGSEEYPEFINSGYNDAFGFFLSGPGISGPFSNNAINLAVVPNTTIPISIDNINGFTYSQYFVNNPTLGNNVIEPDGFTTVLQASSSIQCYQTYHIKMVIADVQDVWYDSYVFLAANTFSSIGLEAQFIAPNLSPNAASIYEGCAPGFIQVTRSEGNLTEEVYLIDDFGQSEFELLQDSLVFAAGQTTALLEITAFDDALVETPELLTLYLYNTGSCSAEAYVDFWVWDVPPLQVELADQNIVCGQSILLDPLITGGLGYYEMTWPGGTTASSLLVAPAVSGNYLVTVTDSCGLLAQTEIFVQVLSNTLWSVDLGPDLNGLCNENWLISPVVNNSWGALSYAWWVNGNVVSTDTTLLYDGNEDAAIILEVMNICGESLSDTLIFDFLAPPLLVDIGDDQSGDCQEIFQVTATINGGTSPYSTSWITSDGQSFLNQEEITLGIASDVVVEIMVEDACGQTAMDTLLIALNQPIIIVDIGNDLNVDCMEQLQITSTVQGGTTPLTYAWTWMGSEIAWDNSLDLNPTANSILELEVIDACGIIGQAAINIQLIDEPLLVDIGPDLYVNCQSEVQISSIVVGGVAPYTYAWSSGISELGDADVLSLDPEEDLSIALLVQDACGTQGIDEMNIFYETIPIQVDIGPDITTDCLSPVNIGSLVTGGVAPYIYTWSSSSIDLSNSDFLIVNPDEDMLVTLQVTDACGAVDLDQANILLDTPPLQLDLGSDITADCLSEVTVIATVEGGLAPYTYQWIQQGQNVGSTSQITFTTDTTTTMVLTVWDACQGMTTNEVTVHIEPVPILFLTAAETTVCPNQNVLLVGAATGGSGSIQLSWQGQNDVSDTLQMFVFNDTLCTLIATDDCGEVAQLDVAVNIASIENNFTAAYLDDYTIQFTNLSDPDYASYWIFSDGEDSYDDDPMHTFDVSDEMEATLVSTFEGCEAITTQLFLPPGSLYIPNCFTADNDGINDVLFAYGYGLVSFEWMIFNRWGELIYLSNDILQPWDGSHLGGTHFSPDGIYQYIASAKDQRGQQIEVQGWVCLIR